MSWFLANDVEKGRAELNFSIWGVYDANKRISKASEMIEWIDEKRMPLKPYLLLHPSARLSTEDVEVLRHWADTLE